ncbi:MAG: FKBP-type peptidyl-prolyl cis-trans isomerase [Spirochaetaceae bacterium]|nr:FKBP-type peptidyl-prolyl cis-trans isomerase [Spirochaetaceae bacterium]
MKKTDNGIYYEITKEGSGAKHTQGTFSVNYTLTLLSGEQIDSSEGRGPFEFVAGQNMVIPGWEESVLDMRPGERRTVVLPPELAYGERGAGGVIPPNSFLVFQLELLGVK